MDVSLASLLHSRMRHLQESATVWPAFKAGPIRGPLTS
jgi:hypothetical protein